jgi:integrase/recombinase XerD
VQLLSRYLKRTQARHGPLFRPFKNGEARALRYQTVQERWASHFAAAAIVFTLYKLRHSHATALVQEGVSLATVRERRGHKHMQTTLRYLRPW